MRRVVEAVGNPPGLIDFDGYRDKQSNRLVGLSRWESEQAFLDALPLIGSLAHERHAHLPGPNWVPDYIRTVLTRARRCAVPGRGR